ncbi:hypothetical protein [Marinospirillum sp.]|uniref:hypothetical protein n=1 Tax=Marinospirillum sp. TaxID=2183934 RepID=UPI003A8A94BD
MLGKLLVALLVFASLYGLWLKQQASLKQRQEAERRKTGPLADDTFADNTRATALTQGKKMSPLIPALIFALLIGSGYGLYHWRDQYQLLEVRVIQPLSGAEEIFWVYKKDLYEGGFTTREGQRVRLAASDRLQVRRADQP